MRHRIRGWAAAVLAAALILIPASVHYRGMFNVGADDEHWSITRRVLESVRERSIAVRAADIPVPVLRDERMIVEGAAHYDAMCSGCHLAPGIDRSELRDGLNPKPPDLTREAGKREPAQRFWIVKHGLKMTGMPAWGRTHDDANLWSIVAFLERLPLLDTAGYRALLASSKAHGDHGHHDNEHRDGAEHEREHEVHDSHGDRGEDNATTRAPTSRSSS